MNMGHKVILPGKQMAAWILVVMFTAACGSLPFISTDKLMEQGIALYKQGSYDESVLKFEQVIEREPGRYLAYVYIARSLIAQFKWGPAISKVREAMKVAPDNTEVLGVLGEALLGGGMAALEQRDFSQAIAYLLEYVQLQPGSARGYLGLARAYFGKSNFGDAGSTLITGLSKASEGREDLVKELLTGGTHALSAGDAGSAIHMLAAYVGEKPNSAPAWVGLGKAYLSEGAVLKAMEAARKALSISPGHADATSLMKSLTGG